MVRPVLGTRSIRVLVRPELELLAVVVVVPGDVTDNHPARRLVPSAQTRPWATVLSSHAPRRYCRLLARPP